MASSKTIRVAAVQLISGTGDSKVVVNPGEELTKAKIKDLGYKAEDLAALIARGQVVEQDVRVAEGGAVDESAALAAAEAKVTDLEKKLAAETKRANDAEAALADLQKQIDEAQANAGANGGAAKSS